MEANIDRFTKAFADAWNSLDISPIEHLLADDFHYSSFWVLEEMTTAAQYLTYLRGKFNTIRKTGSVINAEQIPGKNFIVLMQDGIRKSGIILTINNDDMILRADMMPLEFCR
jgi:hypothetical protein